MRKLIPSCFFFTENSQLVAVIKHITPAVFIRRTHFLFLFKIFLFVFGLNCLFCKQIDKVIQYEIDPSLKCYYPFLGE